MEALSLILVPEQPGVKFNIFNLDEENFYKTYVNIIVICMVVLLYLLYEI